LQTERRERTKEFNATLLPVCQLTDEGIEGQSDVGREIRSLLKGHRSQESDSQIVAQKFYGGQVRLDRVFKLSGLPLVIAGAAEADARSAEAGRVFRAQGSTHE
jgi:hypothetical protein